MVNPHRLAMLSLNSYTYFKDENDRVGYNRKTWFYHKGNGITISKEIYYLDIQQALD